LRRIGNTALLAVVICFAVATWLLFRSGTGAPDPTTTDPAAPYSQLQVSEGDIGWFEGSLLVRNDESADRRAFVTVNLYSVDQNVGELSGDAVLKPNSESVVELISTDDAVGYDEARVDLWFGPP
jgi:hypothetical protein